MIEKNEEVRGKDLLSARECILAQYDSIMEALYETLRNHTFGESLTFSLLSDDLHFASFAPKIKNTQTDEEMAADLSKVLACDPKLSPEYIQRIFGTCTQWDDLVLKNMLPVWVLIANGNRCARAFANCVTLLSFFNDAVEINYPEKPKITFEKGWPQVTLSPDLVTLLRFNIEQRTNLDVVRSALFLGEGGIPIPPAFRATFKDDQSEVAGQTFRRCIAWRYLNHKPMAVLQGPLLKKAGAFKASQADIQRAQLAGSVGLPALDMLEKFSNERQQKTKPQRR